MNQSLDVLQNLGEQFEGLARESRRKRRGISLRWHRRTIIGLVALLVGATGATAAVTLTRGSSRPVAVYGDQICPASYPELAVANPSRIVYPSDFPQRSIPHARRVTCFVTLSDALAAGYKIAATPAGDTKLGPLYMQPAPRSVLQTCKTATRAMHATVYCPTRLPAPWISPTENYNCPTSACWAPVLSLSGSFDAPATYIGSAPGTGDATIWQGTRREEHLYAYLVGCLGNHEHLVRQTTFRGKPAAWYECQMFGTSTSSMFEWRRGSESYGVTADGPARLRTRVVDYMVAHMVAVRAR